ncbi:Cytochrome P450 71D7 [Platanthera zijinensis]|uniref:Cytochrome P450 71D7 n=1 Tax=Platanthera zijinensis TaxID=2320716 RepID=A0AAP0AXR7_9ASPA
MDLLIITLLVFFILLVFIKKISSGHPKEAIRQPPGPWNLPVIGSLHHLLRPQPAHQILNRLSAIHGPIMGLKLGEISAVVVSSSAAAKEILKTHDISFASRPIYSSIKVITYGGKDIAFAPYGEFWRQMRRLCLLELLSAKRVQSFRYIREEEISNLIQSIAGAAASSVSVNLNDEISQLSGNITARAVVGKKTTDHKLFRSAITGVDKLASGLNFPDLFPSMPFIARITGFQRKLEECHQNLEQIREEIIKEHRKNQEGLRPFAVDDIIEVLLRIQVENNLQIPLTDDHIKAVISDLLVAGSSPTSTTLVWAMSELIRNPAVKCKAQSEVRERFGRGMPNTMAEEELMSGDKLSYLKLVIKETLRLHPPAPLLLPRENPERCEVMGYEIPAKTMVMVNAWAMGRDSNNWDEPDAFRPERFDGSDDAEFKGRQTKFIPFGAGRRICPGMSFALAVVEMTLAHLLYYFDWEYFGGELDMTEAPGISADRKFPLCLLPIQHIPLPTS